MYHAATSFLSNCLLQFSKRETMWIHLKALFKIIIAQDEVRDYSLANKRIEITRWRDNFDQYNEIKESFWVYRVINSYRACVTDIISVCKTMLPVAVLGPQQTQQITSSAFRISFHLWTGKLTMAFLTGQSFLKPGTKVATKNNDFGVVLPMDLTRVKFSLWCMASLTRSWKFSSVLLWHHDKHPRTLPWITPNSFFCPTGKGGDKH